jgi:shikimate dehydrogenase
MKTYGILGYPAKHSLSPAMHNAAFKAVKLKAAYKIFEVPPNKLADFFSSLAAKDIAGFNVTVPYKETVLSYLDKISEEAAFIGAVNTIKVVRGKLFGYNTDGQGFMLHLKQECGIIPGGKRIAVLGAGGAGKGVCYYLCKEKPKELIIYNRDRAKAIMLYSRLLQQFDGVAVRVAAHVDDLGISTADIIINTTSVGMRAGDPSLVRPSVFRRDQFVYDLIYTRQTELLTSAKNAGCRVSDGLGMLLYQGMLAFEIWTGKKAPQAIMEKALRAAVSKSLGGK